MFVERSKIVACYLAALLIVYIISPNVSHAGSRSCRIDDLQSCRHCVQLNSTLAGKDPNIGEYYRGALWSGLYASYVLNCQSIGRDLLERGANANAGGDYGLFSVTLTQKWPHNRKEINLQWLRLIRTHGLSAKWTSPFSKQNSIEIVNSGVIVPDYRDIWEELRKGGSDE